MSNTVIPILILAAGQSRRMRGQDKLLRPAPRIPLLRQIVTEAQKIGAPVYVALPDLSGPRAKLITDLGAQMIPVPDADTGISASLRAGIAALPGFAWAMVLLADLPEIRASHIQTLLDHAGHCRSGALRAVDETGTPGHPVILSHALAQQAAWQTGDTGALRFLTSDNTESVPLPGTVATTDLDTPEAWAKWLGDQGNDTEMIG